LYYLVIQPSKAAIISCSFGNDTGHINKVALHRARLWRLVYCDGQAFADIYRLRM